MFTLKKCEKLALTKFGEKPTRSRGFEVRNFYLSFYPPTLSFPWRLVWQSKVSLRVTFFSWSAFLSKILTTVYIRKRRIIDLDWYYMCKKRGESKDHLLLHCLVAVELWSLVFCLIGFHWVMPHMVIEMFEPWQGKFGRHRSIDF